MSKTVHSSLLPCQRQCTKLYFHVKDSALNFTSMSKTVHYSQRINDTMPDCSTITSIIPCMSNNSALFVKHQWHYTRLYFTCQRQCSVCLIQWDYARWFTFTLHFKTALCSLNVNEMMSGCTLSCMSKTTLCLLSVSATLPCMRKAVLCMLNVSEIIPGCILPCISKTALC